MLSSHSRSHCLLARSEGIPAVHGAQTHTGQVSVRDASAAFEAHEGTSECQHPVKVEEDGSQSLHADWMMKTGEHTVSDEQVCTTNL